MKRFFIVLCLGLAANLAHSQANSSAQQSSESNANSFGTLNMSQTPEHTDQTIRNVPSVVMGSFAGSFSQMNCSSTAQAGLSVAGFGIAGGASKDSESCVYEVLAAELARQSTITADKEQASKLQQASINARCLISSNATKAIEAAGLTCQTRVSEREETQPASLRVGTNGN